MDARQRQEQFFYLLRQSMGVTGQKDFEATDEDWQWLYEEAERQSLTGVICGAVTQLPADQQPSLKLLLKWMGETESIKGMNELLYQESARLTKLFEDEGRRTAILKGQANARLYPDKFLRKPGDIDIWVEGGRESVLALLQTAPFASLTGGKKLKPFLHHVGLPAKNKVSIEVHFLPSSGNYNPFTNKRMQQWLNMELTNTQSVEEGFNVPSMKFSLVMQLAHIQRHFLEDGIGLRQICDYFMLLRNSTEVDRHVVAACLKGFGLQKAAGSLMWVLGEVFQMEGSLMLCNPDIRRGKKLLREIIEGGNFGQHAERRKTNSDITFFFGNLRRQMSLFSFARSEMVWYEIDYIKYLFKRLPKRIRRGRLSLR